MSGCPDRLAALSAYLDAELDTTASSELDAHLAACPACRDELEALNAMSEAVQSAFAAARAPAAPGLLRSRISAAIAAEASAPPPNGAVEQAATPRPSGAGTPAATSPANGAVDVPAAASPVAPPGPAAGATHPGAGSSRATILRHPARSALAAAAVVALALVGGYELGSGRGEAVAHDALTAELLSGHLRALLPGRLEDVQSSDRHQVKPWFAGRLDFSPPVPDLAGAGFPLLGGRLDFVAGQRAAVLVYGRRLHIVDVFVLPAAGRAVPLPAATRLGYNFVSWREGPLQLIAVSDLDSKELRQLAGLHARAAGSVR